MSDTEIVEAPVVEPVVEPEVPVPEPEPKIELDISEEDIQAAIDQALASFDKPTEPVSFPKEEAVKEDLNSEIQALLKQKESELESTKSELEQVESAWQMLNQAIPDLPDVLTKIVAGEENAIPVFYRKDFQEKLQSDAVLWPLIDSYIKGEKPDYPGFIRGLASARVKSMPQQTESEKEATIPAPVESSNPGHILSKNKRTISFN